MLDWITWVLLIGFIIGVCLWAKFPYKKKGKDPTMDWKEWKPREVDKDKL